MDETVSLREYVERILDEREKRWSDKFDAVEKSARAAKAASDEAIDTLAEVRRIRDEGQNEWRKTVEDMRGGYASLETVVDLARRVGELEKAGGKDEGRRVTSLLKRQGTVSNLNIMYGAIGAIGVVAGVLIAVLA